MNLLKHSLFILQCSLPLALFCNMKEEEPKVNLSRKDYASNYTNIDLSVNVGYSALYTKELVSEPALIVTADEEFGAPGVAAQLKLAGTYGFWDQWMTGFEIYGQYNSARIREEVTSGLHNLVTTITMSMHWNVGLDWRLGYVYSKENSIYVYLGPDWGFFKYEQDVHPGAATSSFSMNRVIPAPRFGAAAEQKFCEHWVMRESFDYAWYWGRKHTFSNGSSYTFKNQLATFLFSLGYVF